MTDLREAEVIKAAVAETATALPSGISERLQQLRSQSAHRFDPVRWRYIEALERRAREHKPTVAALVLGKAGSALDDYEHRWQCHLSVKNSDSEISEPQTTEPRSALRALTLELLQDDLQPQQTWQQMSFGDRLQQQELDLLQKVDTGMSGASELKSVRLFRESLARVNASNRVAESVAKGPENPGPLNEHQLAIRSLRTLRELSPQYLNRFVSYMDTLFWLEKAGAKLDAEEKKKSQPASRRKKK
ncbi:DUF2894 domain-containing protein [Pseudomaricurvus alkylphenolicus]|jgi:hypothetical protein|uniref:DUF2894 domain-containing protein n=1 Tax=Pseudomaricurvus alkylphenolicus TaxID=1306991 RepID=UPI00141E8079|nr:DUF2894 domain-containing protein [Pseudomaricurvus alkylphenolicus]NIB42983.1 DUF2894 domain-containing protein [Pseudomaricurvus alkylphenolicus]